MNPGFTFRPLQKSNQENEVNENPGFTFRALNQENEKTPENQSIKLSEPSRIATGLGARAGESALGWTGNLRKFVNDMIIGSYENAGLGFGEDLTQPSGKKREAPDWLKSVLGESPQKEQMFPSTSELKEKFTKPVSEKLFGEKEYLEPRSEQEKQAQNLVQSIVAYSSPGTGQFKMGKNIGIPVFGNLLESGLGHLTSDEKEKAYATMGSQLAMDLMMKGNAKKFSKNLYKSGEDLLENRFSSNPQSLQVHAQSFIHDLHQAYKDMKKGGMTEDKSPPMKRIGEILGKIDKKTHTIDVRELTEFQRNINSDLKSKGFYDLPKNDREVLELNLNKVKSSVMKGIDEYGKKDPEFMKIRNAANESYTAYHKSNLISRVLSKYVGNVTKSNAIKVLFGAGATGGAAGLGKLTLGTTVPGLAALPIYQGVKIFERMRRSPTLRKYYIDVLKQASKNNIPALTQAWDKLDSALAEEEIKED